MGGRLEGGTGAALAGRGVGGRRGVAGVGFAGVGRRQRRRPFLQIGGGGRRRRRSRRRRRHRSRRQN